MSIHEEMTIITPDGEKQLKTMKKVTSMLDANGAFQNIYATFIEDFHGYFYEFCFKSIPFTIKLTADHLIYSAKSTDIFENKVANEKPGFVKASFVNIYEYVSMPFLQEISELLPINLPIEKDNFWFLLGVLLNRVAIGKSPKIEANRINVQLFNEELKMVRFPDDINKIPSINGIVIINPTLAAYLNSVIENPLQLLYLPKKHQSAIYDGFFFDKDRPPASIENKLMFVMWYIYCRVNKKLAHIQSTKSKEYKLSISANPTPCTETNIWFRVSDIRVTVEKTRIYHFKAETPSIVVGNFIVRPQ